MWLYCGTHGVWVAFIQHFSIQFNRRKCFILESAFTHSFIHWWYCLLIRGTVSSVFNMWTAGNKPPTLWPQGRMRYSMQHRQGLQRPRSAKRNITAVYSVDSQSPNTRLRSKRGVKFTIHNEQPHCFLHNDPVYTWYKHASWVIWLEVVKAESISRLLAMGSLFPVP